MISESILEGELVRLRPMQPGDLPKFVEWLADPEVRRWLANVQQPPTMQDEMDWYESTRENPDNVLWSIETLDGQLVGTIELRVTQASRRAELGIAIQDKAQWNKGYGTDAVKLAVEYGFDDLELNRVELTTDAENARGRRCYEKCGFVQEGLLRQHRFVEGRFGDTRMMSVLREEWEER